MKLSQKLFRIAEVIEKVAAYRETYTLINDSVLLGKTWGEFLEEKIDKLVEKYKGELVGFRDERFMVRWPSDYEAEKFRNLKIISENFDVEVGG